MDIQGIIEELHPLERRALPFLSSSRTLSELAKKSGLQEVEAMRALQWLENKDVLKIKSSERELIVLGENGKIYSKKGLPERRMLNEIKNSPILIGKLIEKIGKEEFEIAVGILKQKAAISIIDGKISITDSGKKLLQKEMLEENFLNKLNEGAMEIGSLGPEEKFAFDNLMKRKKIIEKNVEKIKEFELTEIGRRLSREKIEINDLLELVTPEMLKNSSWKGKKFRKYDVTMSVPEISGGKRHFVNRSIEYGKKIWTDLGFKEMTGKKTITSFWNFDALFTAQDHPVREMQDTFFIKGVEGKLPDKKIVSRVKETHEKGVEGSKGWQYAWSEKEARKVLLRTHTTCLSSQTLVSLKKEDLPAKFFAIGKCFRNETVDWSHGFEFNQSEGIVVDPDANLRHLIGYLKLFAKKMGFEKIRIQPAYFPYTEPSLEGAVWSEEKQEWVEVLAAGIFRPEVTIPLLGTAIPVLAWGPGFDRLMMKSQGISDLREIYKNDLKQIRNKKFVVNT